MLKNKLRYLTSIGWRKLVKISIMYIPLHPYYVITLYLIYLKFKYKQVSFSRIYHNYTLIEIILKINMTLITLKPLCKKDLK